MDDVKRIIVMVDVEERSECMLGAGIKGRRQRWKGVTGRRANYGRNYLLFNPQWQ
jgi:hypothetical protein